MNPPSNGNGNSNGRVRVPLNLSTVSILIALLAQLGGVIVWATNEHNARVALEQRVDDRIKLANDVMKSQGDQLSRVTEFVRNLDNRESVTTTANSARFDSIDGHFSRVDDRIDRIVQALDKTYHLLNEHMRDPKLHRPQQ